MGSARFFGEGLTYLNPGDLKGKLIAIEGTDGVGRSTHIEMLLRTSSPNSVCVIPPAPRSRSAAIAER